VWVQARLFHIHVSASFAGPGTPLRNMQVHFTEAQNMLLQAAHPTECKLAGVLDIGHCTATHAFGTVDLRKTTMVD